MKTWYLGQIISFFLALALFLAGYPKNAISFALGALLHCIPHAFLGWQLFKYQGARAARQITKSVYTGVFGKWLLTIIFFAVVFQYDRVVPVALLAGLIVAIMLTWITTAQMKVHNKNS